MTSRNTILKNSIDGFLARRGMSRSRFGLETAGNPSLVARIAAGRVIRLDSADRILAYMGKEPFGPAFRREVEAFIAITGTKASLLGQEAVGDPSFARRLRHGASPSLDTCDRVSAWMESQSSEAERLAVRATVPDTPKAVVTETAQTEAMTDGCPSGYTGSQEYRRTATRRATQFPWDAEPIVQINYGPWILEADNCEAVIPTDWGGDPDVGGGGEPGDVGGDGDPGDDSCDTASTPDDPGSDVCSVDSSIGFDTDTSGLGDGGDGDAGDGGACFLTTAIVERRGIEADGGPTLTALRRFRDGYMMKTSKRRALVAEYYELAPRIVAAIPETHSDWDWIGGRIDAAIAAIAAGDEDGAFGIYAAMVRRLAGCWTEPGSRMAAGANTTKGARR